MNRIAIIGGGAAGMMCAAVIAEEAARLSANPDLKVHIFERNNRLGIKVALSGGGRCNVTTGLAEPEEVLKRYVRGGKFLKPAMLAFPPQKMIQWLKSHGLETKVEEDTRVFPRSDRGQDVVDVFTKIFQAHKVDIHFTEPVISISKLDNGFQLQTNKAEYEFDKLVIASGGNAYRFTGSKGDGYTFAQSLGHSITKLGPSLNSFETLDEWSHDLKGVSLKNAKLVATDENQTFDAQGPMIFTHFGISGPMVFAFAAQSAFSIINKSQPLSVRLIPQAEISMQDWEKRIMQSPQTKRVFSILKEILPARLVSQIMHQAAISEQTIFAELPRRQRQNLIGILGKGIHLQLKNRRQGDEFVTAGGVNLAEVNWKTMQSKLVEGLYFAGEVLDIDGLTGGFNLQAAWSTGYLSAKSISMISEISL